MNHLDIIRSFSRSMKLELSYGGNNNSKINMMERCIGGDLLEVHLSPEEDEFADAQDFGWKLLVDVMVKRAPYDFEDRLWRWEPKEIAHGKIAFHHWDHAELLKRGAEWLLEHEDHKTGLVPAWDANRKDVGPVVRTVKCGAIGRLKHYTTVKGFEDA
jgi:hypothetical protein